jgi:aminoglycoside phosphotransferase (APT) family kinase protein
LVLIGLAGVLPRYGVLASWTLPLLITLLPVNRLLFRRLIPQHMRATRDSATPPTPKQIGRFIAGDYLGSLIWYATTSFLPVLVAVRAGATANAYFYLSWTIAYSLYLVSLNMGQSLIAEGATDVAKLDVYSYRMFVQTARLLVPAVLLIVVGAPYVLRIFGAGYSTEGTTLLRLLSLSALPNIVTSLYISVARVQRRMKRVVLCLSVLSVMVLSLGYLLMGVAGITGVGIAWLVGQSLMAAFLLTRTQLRTAWLSQIDLRLLGRVTSWPRTRWWNFSHRRRVTAASQLIEDILPTILPLADAPPPRTWSIQHLVRTVNDVMVVTLGPTDGAPAGILKLAKTDSAAESLRRQSQVLRTLQADSRLSDWRALLPTVLAEDMTLRQPYIVERIMPGIEARHLMVDWHMRDRVLSTAAKTIGELHRRTATLTEVDDKLISQWVDEPLARLRRVRAAGVGAGDYGPVIDQLSAELHTALSGHQAAIGWIHGDFVPGNILATADGAVLTGIIDWDLAAPSDLPLLDMLQLLVSTRVHVEERELGAILTELLSGESAWTPHENELLTTAQQTLPGEALDLRALLLLCWLRHVDANLSKSERYARHSLWMARNVDAVLRHLTVDRA